MKWVYPHQVKSLADDVNTQVFHYTLRKSKRWILDISGPFCFVKAPTMHNIGSSQLLNLRASLSNILALPVESYTRDYYTIILQVGIDKATEDRLIKAEYKRATKNNSCVFAVRVL